MDDEGFVKCCWMMGIVLERVLGIEGEIKLKVVGSCRARIVQTPGKARSKLKIRR